MFNLGVYKNPWNKIMTEKDDDEDFSVESSSSDEDIPPEHTEDADNKILKGKSLITAKRTEGDNDNQSDLKEEHIAKSKERACVYYSKKHREKIKQALIELDKEDNSISSSPNSSQKRNRSEDSTSSGNSTPLKKRKIQVNQTVMANTVTAKVTAKVSSPATSSKKISLVFRSATKSATTSTTTSTSAADSSRQASAPQTINLTESLPVQASAPLNYRAFVSTSEATKSSDPVTFDETKAFVLPLPFQELSRLEAIKLAHSIIEADKQDSTKTSQDLKKAMEALTALSKEEVRKGALATLAQAATKGEKAVDFYKSLEKLSQYKDSLDIQPLQTRYRLEYYTLDDRRYKRFHIVNSEAAVTIRLYRPTLSDSKVHYDLLIVKS